MNARRICVVVMGFAAAAGLLGLRQVRLERIREVNRQLRCEVEARRMLPSTQPAVAEPAHGVEGALSEAEHLELLRLRGEMAVLRRDLDEALAVGEVKPPARGVPEPAAIEEVTRTAGWTNALALGPAIRAFIEDHEGGLPRDLGALTGGGIAVSTAGFELIRKGELTGEERQFKLVAREIEPHQLDNGQWVRIYIQADARPCIAGPFVTPDWAAFENLHDGVMRERVRRETVPQGVSPTH